jgi:hypothetical protein
MRKVPVRGPKDFAPPLSKYGHRLTCTQTIHRCGGCGRMLPIGSFVQQWSIWGDSRKIRHRYWICSQCEDVIYGCNGHDHLNPRETSMLVRYMCRRCDSFPTCERVNWLRESKPGDVWFGDLCREEIPEQRRTDLRP